jgi:hypothetical protein
LLCASSHSAVFGRPFSAFGGFGLSSSLFAGVLSLTAAGEVYFVAYVEALVIPEYGCGWAGAYIYKAISLGVAPVPVLGSEAPSIHFGGHHLGSVDCWPCQIFARSLGAILPSFRVFTRDEAWISSS